MLVWDLIYLQDFIDISDTDSAILHNWPWNQQTQPLKETHFPEVSDDFAVLHDIFFSTYSFHYSSLEIQVSKQRSLNNPSGAWKWWEFQVTEFISPICRGWPEACYYVHSTSSLFFPFFFRGYKSPNVLTFWKKGKKWRVVGQGGGAVRGNQNAACILLRRRPRCSELESVNFEFKEVTRFRKLTELFTSKWMLKNCDYICSVMSDSLWPQGL